MANKKKTRTPNIPPATPQTSQVTAPTSSKARKSARQRKQQRSQMYLILAAVVVIVVVGALIVLNNRSQAQISAPPVVSSLPSELVSRTVKGSPDAKVVVTEFSDFECPACQGFAGGTAKAIEDEYVKTGKIRFEYKHFPLPQHEPSATNAALASECAADQGKFWEMHDYLFQEQGKQGTNTFTQIRLKAMAQELGLDAGQFDQCLSRQEHAQAVQDDVNAGRQLNVNSTPSIFVNGQRVLNPSLTELRAAIDAALQQQGVQ